MSEKVYRVQVTIGDKGKETMYSYCSTSKKECLEWMQKAHDHTDQFLKALGEYTVNVSGSSEQCDKWCRESQESFNTKWEQL